MVTPIRSRGATRARQSFIGSRHVAVLLAVVTEIGSSAHTGRGWVTTPKVPVAVGEIHGFAAPQTVQFVDGLEHRIAVVWRSAVKTQHKVIAVPTACNRQRRAPANILRDRRPGNRRVRTGATKGVERALRRPDRAKPVGVSQFRAFHQHLIFLEVRTIIGAPIPKRNATPFAEVTPPEHSKTRLSPEGTARLKPRAKVQNSFSQTEPCAWSIRPPIPANKVATLRCSIITPFGLPLDPEV